MFREKRSTGKGLAAGAIGGAVASFAMNQAQAAMSRLFERRGDAGAERKGREAQGWKQYRAGARRDPTAEERANVKAAVAVSQTVFDRELSPAQKEWAGQLVHYAYGTAAGALYGAAAEHWDGVRAGQGGAFGVGLWALSDLAAIPALRLSGPPERYPLRAHAMALASHLVYSVTTELARRVLRSGALSR